MTELKSGDIAIEVSEEFGDYREGLLDWKDCERLLAEYCTTVELSANAVDFVTNLKAELTQKADEVAVTTLPTKTPSPLMKKAN